MNEFLIPFLVSLIFSIIITLFFIKKFKKMGITGLDVHKTYKWEVAEMGGIPILISFVLGFMSVIYFFSNEMLELVAILSTIILAGIVGIIDDRSGMRQRVKAVIPVFAAIPLMIIQAGHHEMSIPFVGEVNFGLIYPLLFIPLAITVVSNAFNMLAGYNGLESGMGLIASFFMGIASYITGAYMVSSFMFAMAGTLAGFLFYNKYPSKIFPGDSGVFIMGSAVAAAAIVANLEVVGIILLLPYIINGAITSIDILRKKPIEKFAKVDKDGYLRPPSRKYVYNLYYTLENLKKTKEKELVFEFWALEFICGIAALIVISII